MKKRMILLALGEYRISKEINVDTGLFAPPTVNYETRNSWTEIEKYSFVAGFISGFIVPHEISFKQEFLDKLEGMSLS
jgi:hypothetical protein